MKDIYILRNKKDKPLWKQLIWELFWLTAWLSLITVGVWAYVHGISEWQRSHSGQPNFIEDQEKVNQI